MSERRPLIVGIGGTTRFGSTSETALRHALETARRAGAATDIVAGPPLALPHYFPGDPDRSPEARRLIEALRAADGVIVSSPSYHGSISGMLKNALDYVEDLRNDRRPYLEGRAVGCIICGHGMQSMGTSLAAMRSVIHALRAWPTPFAATLNSASPLFAAGHPLEEATSRKLTLVAKQVLEFARMRILFEADSAGERRGEAACR